VHAPIPRVWLENPLQGHRVRFLTLPAETGGRGFTLEYVYRPFTGESAVPAHIHTAATERFEILSGEARYRVGRDERSARQGDTLVLPAGVPHVHPWSVSGEELHVRQTTVVDPPDQAGLVASLQALVTLFGLAAAGKVNGKGLPNLLQLAVLIRSTMPATYIAGIPIAVQRMLFGGLARVGHAAGYRTAYGEYGVLTDAGLQWPDGMPPGGVSLTRPASPRAPGPSAA
jgi:mannose-6-phosphate isomerase-like protein (cupin superfamily)